MCGDCLELMKCVDNHTIDLLLTDPPYNVSRENNFTTMGSACRQWMDFGEWDKDFDTLGWIQHLPRVLKENANVVIFNARENLGDIKRECEKNNIYMKRCLVLNKSNPAPFNRDRMFVNDVEFALWGVYNSKWKPTKWTFNRENPLEKCVIDTTVQSSKLHPTMKDIKVIEYLVRTLSNEGDLVLDPFIWSGTTALACMNLDRDFIWMEIDLKYVEIANKRLLSNDNSKMLLTDEQAKKFVDWFMEKYKDDCTTKPDGRKDIPIVYSENPKETEKQHAEMWLNKIRELMWKNADKKYTHRGGRTETYAEAQFSSLWLYCWPIFKHINEKDAQQNTASWQEDLWNIHWWEWEE